MRYAVLSPFIFLLSACGGDEESPAPPPTPTPAPTPVGPNTAPTFTSGTAASIIENGTLAYQGLASDAQNDPITLSISGGADAGLFSLDVTGRMIFRTAPNFDMPGDANGDSIYEVTLSASDGRASSSQDVRITVTNSREGVAVRRISAGFSQPIQTHPVPNAPGDVYVIEKGGRLYRLTTATGERTLLLTLDDISTDGERGLLGVTSGPTSASGGRSLYLFVTARGGDVQLRQYVLSAAGVPTGSLVVLLTIPHPNNNHNGGWLDFGPDGLLYMAVGDGGGAGDPGNNAQNPNSRLGKILRLALGPGGWGPAPGNVYAAGGGDPYIFALGLRNPFRNGFEGETLIVADVGQGALEEVSFIPIDSRGANLGWPFREGTQPFRGTAPAGLIDPVLQYGRGSGPFEGETVIGGRVYRGPIPGIRDHYLFADFVDGHIWSVPFSDLRAGSTLDRGGFELRDTDFTPDAGTIDMPVSFDDDGAGNIVITDLDGEIFHVIAE